MLFTVILYLLIFGTCLIAWIAHSADKTKKSKFETASLNTPNILIALIAGTWLCFPFLSFFFDIKEISNNWVILLPLIPCALALSCIYRHLAVDLEQVAKNNLFKISKVILGITITFFSANTASTYIERLTSVSPGVFAPFTLLVTLLLSFVLWLVVAQALLLLICSVLSIHHFYNNRKIPNHSTKIKKILPLLFITTVTTTFYAIPLTQKLILNIGISYLVEEWFVDQMYHVNLDKNDHIMCNKYLKDQQIILLPSGRVSVAKDGLNFITGPCNKE